MYVLSIRSMVYQYVERSGSETLDLERGKGDKSQHFLIGISSFFYPRKKKIKKKDRFFQEKLRIEKYDSLFIRKFTGRTSYNFSTLSMFQ